MTALVIINTMTFIKAKNLTEALDSVMPEQTTTIVDFEESEIYYYDTDAELISITSLEDQYEVH